MGLCSTEIKGGGEVYVDGTEYWEPHRLGEYTPSHPVYPESSQDRNAEISQLIRCPNRETDMESNRQ